MKQTIFSPEKDLGMDGNISIIEIVPYQIKNEGWFLRVVYEITNPFVTKRIIIPQIKFPLLETDVPYIYSEAFPASHYSMPDIIIHAPDCGYIDIPGGALKVYSGEDEDVKGIAILRIMDEKPEEVTMDDIERKFGHKIKIVNSEGIGAKESPKKHYESN